MAFLPGLKTWDPTTPPQYQAPQYYGANQSAGDINSVIKTLGYNPQQYLAGGPQDARAAESNAVMGQLAKDENTARVLSDQAALNRGTGAYRSAGQIGRLGQIQSDFAGQRANALAGIEKDFADRSQAYDFQRAQTDQQAQLQALIAALSNQRQHNDFSSTNAEDQYKANELAPYQQKQAILGAGLNGLGTILGAFL